MITLFILGLAGTGLAFAAVPVVGFALMVETCGNRAGRTSRTVAATADRRTQSEGFRLASA